MKTLTVRGVNERALDQLKKQAISRHCSVNKLVVETLRKIAFPGEAGTRREWHDLDSFLGSWSDEEYRQTIRRCGKCRKTDSELWQ